MLTNCYLLSIIYTCGQEKPLTNDPLAQLAEHLTFNQGVRSSNLRWVTKETVVQGIFFILCTTVFYCLFSLTIKNFEFMRVTGCCHTAQTKVALPPLFCPWSTILEKYHQIRSRMTIIVCDVEVLFFLW